MNKRLPKCFRTAYDYGESYHVADRYTIFFRGQSSIDGDINDECYARGMSTNAMMPNGFNLYAGECYEFDETALGNRIEYSKLPNQVKRAIKMECEELGVD